MAVTDVSNPQSEPVGGIPVSVGEHLQPNLLALRYLGFTVYYRLMGIDRITENRAGESAIFDWLCFSRTIYKWLAVIISRISFTLSILRIE